MFKMKRDIDQKYFRIVDLIFVKSQKFALVYRVSDTQLQVSENSNYQTFKCKSCLFGLKHIYGPSRASVNLLPATLSYLNIHPLEVVSRYRDPQLQVGENYSYLLNLRPNICKS